MAGTDHPAEDAPQARDETPAGAVALEQANGIPVLRVSGALDLAIAPKLQQLVERAARTRPQVMVIDLTEVDFLASVGMSVLVRAHREHSSAIAVRVVAASTITLKPLEMTRLTDELAVYPTVSEALAGP